MKQLIAAVIACLTLSAVGAYSAAAAPEAGHETTRPAGTSSADTQPATPTTQPTTRPVAEITHVVIVSMDGLRPDVALRGDAPHIRKLMAHGAFTFWARTTEVSITLPSHTSMLTGVTPNRHGVTWNADQPGPQKYPKFPTIFELAKDVGYTTAMATGKTKFTALDRPGTVDWASIRSVHDDQVGKAAAEIIKAHRPDVLFVHFPDIDANGHAHGWGSHEQVEAVHGADVALGMVMDALDESGLTDSTLIILSADHGGQGRGHGPNDVRSRHIPWIASNPHLLQNYDLVLNAPLVVNTEDTFATACYFLGIPHAAHIDGKPISQLVPNQELLHAGP